MLGLWDWVSSALRRFLDLPDREAREQLRTGHGEFLVGGKVHHHHWVVFVVPALGVVTAVLLFLTVTFSSAQLAVLYLVAIGLGAWSLFEWWARWVDVFVVTNQRIMRLNGVISKKRATMPTRRILDLTVDIPGWGVVPVLGRFLDYGHLTFESAAQKQGLKNIRFLEDPTLLEKQILDLMHGEVVPPDQVVDQ